MTKLKSIYAERKGSEDEFEIIYISFDCGYAPSSYSDCIEEMPWLIHPYQPDFSDCLARKVFKRLPLLPAIAAFGTSGQLVSKASNLLFEQHINSTYPFIRSMEDEVLEELIHEREWDLKNHYFRK